MSTDFDESKPKAPKIARKYTMKDLHKLLDGKDPYSGFGIMRVSTKQTGPTATFGKADRAVQSKVYTCKADLKGLIGKNSNKFYAVTDKFSYVVPPKFSFAKSKRNTLDIKSKYDYYTQPESIMWAHVTI